MDGGYFVRALANTRDARGGLAVKSAQAALSPPGRPSRFLQMGLCEFIKDPKGEKKRAPLPLGWQLSETSRMAMEDQLGKGFNDACPFSDNWRTMEAIGALLGQTAAMPDRIPAVVSPAQPTKEVSDGARR